MSVEYEWRFDKDDLDQAPKEDGTAKRRPHWPTRLAAVVVILLLAGLGVFLVWRLRRASTAETAEDVRAAVQLELRALEDGDAELFLGLQDDEDPDWLESRRRRLSEGSLLPPPAPGFIATAPVTIETPTVIGGRAEVAFVRLAGPPGGEQYPHRAVSFYRLLDDGRWVHTAPDPRYAGRTLVWVGPRNDLAGHIVGTDLFEQLAPELELLAAAFCELFACPPDLRFSLAFTDTLVSSANLVGALPAPHLVGVPQGESARAAWSSALKDHLVEQMLSRVVGEPVGGLVGAGLRAQIKEYLGVEKAHQADPALLAEALAGGGLPALADLWAGTVEEGQTAVAEDAAAVLVRFIEREYGREGVIGLLEATARVSSLDALFAVGLGADVDSIEQRWLDYLEEAIAPKAALPIRGTPVT